MKAERTKCRRRGRTRSLRSKRTRKLKNEEEDYVVQRKVLITNWYFYIKVSRPYNEAGKFSPWPDTLA